LDAVVAQARETGADALISVGGGSTHDTTKGVATVLGEGGRIHDYEAKWVRA
jgi:alcohol dehydrogenase